MERFGGKYIYFSDLQRTDSSDVQVPSALASRPIVLRILGCSSVDQIRMGMMM
jgi:hypothetical protein